MRIVNIAAQPVEACCVFEYKGFEVSASTVFRSQSVFVCEVNEPGFLSPQLDTVEAAIAWIDSGKADQSLKDKDNG